MNINKNVDLGKSFEKLKASLLDAIDSTKGTKAHRYPYSFGKLETAVKKHLIDCTDITGQELYKEIEQTDPNDLKDVL